MSGSETRGWVAPLAIGLVVLGVLGCAGVFVLLAAGGAAAWLAVRVPSQPQQVSGPIAIRQAATPVETPSALRTEGSFAYVDAVVTSEPAPARFAAALPVTREELDGFLDEEASFPPFSHVSDLACAGDPAMAAKILASARTLHQKGVPASELDSYYGDLFRYCDPPGRACDFLEGVITGKDPAAVKNAFWRGFEDCRDPKYDATFERPDSPAGVYIRRLRDRDPAYSKRLEQAAAEVIETGEVYTAREAAFALGARDDARAARALLAIHAAEAAPDKKRVIALALWRQTDPAAVALFQKTCDAEGTDASGGMGIGGRDPVCDSGSKLAREKHLTLETAKVQDLLSKNSFDIDDIVAATEKTRPTELVAALDVCAETYSEWQARRCLSALAVRDWKRASAIAARMPRPEDFGATELRQALRTFDDRAALIARLRTDGVLAAGDRVDARVAEPRELLERAGRLYQFDTETGGYPNEHDSLLRTLAVLAAPDLDGIVFLEDAPELDDETGYDDGSPYLVDAWLGGRRWSMKAANDSDWLDVERCVGLLNRILEDRGSAKRFLTLRTDDQTATVVAGNASGLERFAKDRLLVTADPSASAESGKAFEQQAIDALRREEESR